MNINSFFIDKCPVCSKPLHIDKKTSSGFSTVKVCTKGHYSKEIYPYLEQTIEFYHKSNQNLPPN